MLYVCFQSHWHRGHVQSAVNTSDNCLPREEGAKKSTVSSPHGARLTSPKSMKQPEFCPANTSICHAPHFGCHTECRNLHVNIHSTNSACSTTPRNAVQAPSCSSVFVTVAALLLCGTVSQVCMGHCCSLTKTIIACLVIINKSCIMFLSRINNLTILSCFYWSDIRFEWSWVLSRNIWQILHLPFHFLCEESSQCPHGTPLFCCIRDPHWIQTGPFSQTSI